MFSNAKLFNAYIGDWDVYTVRYMRDIFNDSNMSIQNYNALLNNWSQLNLQNNVAFGASNINFTIDANASRQSIIDNFGWSISDAGIQ